ncbi:MAG: hypothetical protein NTU69_01230 [Proteobacteria bacterium]|nr:hypothetical protein [Pseudomonadota bacterium]
MYKSILNKLEESSPGTKIQFVKGYLKMVKEGEREISYCVNCGYPSYGEKCNMCRILERFGIKNSIIQFEEYNA